MIFEDILPSLKNYNTFKKIVPLHSEIVLLNLLSQRMKARPYFKVSKCMEVWNMSLSFWISSNVFVNPWNRRGAGHHFYTSREWTTGDNYSKIIYQLDCCSFDISMGSKTLTGLTVKPASLNSLVFCPDSDVLKTTCLLPYFSKFWSKS